MSRAASSPTARLLQSSRLFSLPSPLPSAPPESVPVAGMYRCSDSATLPHPTHQAVTTPPSSHFRGDWGVKRPLPKRATKSGVIRLHGQDTSEHVTDFASAADHVRTREKWAEMGVPMVWRGPKTGATHEPPAVSAFHSAVDHTTSERHLPDTKGSYAEMTRWKYRGPWIAGMVDGEFNSYLASTVTRHKAAWRRHLRRVMAEDHVADKTAKAHRAGTPLSAADKDALRRGFVASDQDTAGFEKRLRHSHLVDRLSSRLTSLVADFFDLPATRASGHFEDGNTRFKHRLYDTLNASPRNVPPSTHPSAGLSHILTDAIMENHPQWGPQLHRTPVLARVLQPRNSTAGVKHSATIGVAGFVTEEPSSMTARTVKSSASQEVGGFEPIRMASQLDTSMPGGNKFWVVPWRAWVDENSKVQLEVGAANREAVSVKTGNVDWIHEAKGGAPTPKQTRSRGPAAAPSSALPTSEASWLSDWAKSPKGVEGFDADLQGPEGLTDIDDEREAVRRIRELIPNKP